MTHHPIVAQALYYCIVAIVPTPQPRKPQTCKNIYIYIYIYVNVISTVSLTKENSGYSCFLVHSTHYIDKAIIFHRSNRY
jgi:hypothetical protein